MVGVQKNDDQQWKEDEEAELLDFMAMKEYQSVVARLNYLCLDRSDVQFAFKEVMRKMSAPTEVDVQKLKRVLRYLKGAPRVIQTYLWEDLPEELTIYVDSNFAEDQ